MADLRKGDVVAVPCTVCGRSFVGEKPITIETVDGPVSGFVSAAEIQELSRGRGLIPGTVMDVTQNVVTVRIHGSFFTTAGLAEIPLGREVLASARH